MTEIRYRRLLALYPGDFRREYEEEMLGVLLADPRPGPAQAFDVVRGALAAHLRGLLAGESEAARVVQIFGAMLLFAVALRRVTGVFALRFGPVNIDAVSWLRVAGWGVALLAAFLGWRVLGTLAASAGLAGEIASPARFYLDTPATVLHVYWLIVTAGVVLIAGLAARGGTARPRGWILMATAGAILAGHGLGFPVSLIVGGGVRPEELATPRFALLLLALVLIAAAVIRQRPAIRSRLACWAAPVIVTVPLVQWGFGGFIEFNMRHPEGTRLIGWWQWAVLALVPIATFAGAAALRRRGPDSLTVSGREVADK